MNERIRLLAEQAGVSITAANKNGVFTLLPDSQKKFAELIVRECAKRVDYWESRQGEHADDLLKHFGVEE